MTRLRLEERRRRLDRIAERYGELEEALKTLESLADVCFLSIEPEPMTESRPNETARPRQPR
jgi:hypothetical protein